MNKFFDDYYKDYKTLLINDYIEGKLIEFKSLAESVKRSDSKIIFAGNGASASIAAHGATDFTKQGKIRSMTFNEANLITCLSNDFGYENWMKEALRYYAGIDDLIVLISVSGESKNTIEAAKYAKSVGNPIVTFTGKSEDNTLKGLGDLNFWVDSHAYNIVECIHMIWITSVVDAVIGKAVYDV